MGGKTAPIRFGTSYGWLWPIPFLALSANYTCATFYTTLPRLHYGASAAPSLCYTSAAPTHFPLASLKYCSCSNAGTAARKERRSIFAQTLRTHIVETPSFAVSKQPWCTHCILEDGQPPSLIHTRWGFSRPSFHTVWTPAANTGVHSGSLRRDLNM